MPANKRVNNNAVKKLCSNDVWLALSSATYKIVRQAKECQMQQRCHIFGMRGAGSLIAEFMLTAVG